MQWFELFTNDTIKLLIESPLDGTAIDPITRSPNYHHETGKVENLSRANLCLAHSPLELDDDDLDFLKLDHLSWLRWLYEDKLIAPPYSTTGEPLFGISSQVHCYHNVRQASSMISSWCSTWTCTPQSWWRSPLDVILHGWYNIFLLTQAHGNIPNPT